MSSFNYKTVIGSQRKKVNVNFKPKSTLGV